MHSQHYGKTYQGDTTVHTMTPTFFSENFYGVLVLRRTQRDQLQHATKMITSLYIHKWQKVPIDTKAKTGALYIFRLALEPCSHNPGDLLDAAPGCLLCLYGWSMHHRLQGDIRVLALETC
jgi:hypothetical protein